MNKISIGDMEYIVQIMGDDYIIFSMVDFDNWGLSVNKFMWQVMAHRLKRNGDGEFLEHQFDYMLERPIMSKSEYGIVDFEEARTAMNEVALRIEGILEQMQGEW